MVRSINEAIQAEQGRLTEIQLNRAFERCWPELQQCLANLPEPQEPLPPRWTPEDMLEEILEVVRHSLSLILKSTFDIRRSQVLKKAEEIRDALRRLDPEDPYISHPTLSDLRRQRAARC